MPAFQIAVALRVVGTGSNMCQTKFRRPPFVDSARLETKNSCQLILLFRERTLALRHRVSTYNDGST